jgi:hypothetical protein
MITTNLKGGLGNQMFQYATGLALAQKNNDELLIDNSGYFDSRVVNSDTPRTYELGHFNISASVASPEQINKAKYPYGIFSKIIRGINKKILQRNYLDFHPEIFANPTNNKNIYLDGFFQSEKNFLSIRSQLLKEFSLKKDLPNKDLTQEIEQSNSVAVHIRHGDYLNDPKTNEYHGTCSEQYYQKAIDEIRKTVTDPIFYLFSDDPEWINDNFEVDGINMKIGTDSKLSPQEELVLMSKCKHNIIANSSFSWWAAWLNQNDDKIVIAPTPWVDKEPNPHKNIIPESWIQIPKN